MTVNEGTELGTEEVRTGVPQLKSPFMALIHSFQTMIIFHPSEVLSAALLSS